MVLEMGDGVWCWRGRMMLEGEGVIYSDERRQRPFIANGSDERCRRPALASHDDERLWQGMVVSRIYSIEQ